MENYVINRSIPEMSTILFQSFFLALGQIDKTDEQKTNSDVNVHKQHKSSVTAVNRVQISLLLFNNSFNYFLAQKTDSFVTSK